MRKRDAVNASLEQMDAQQRQDEQQRKKDALNEKKESVRPPLVKRLFAGVVDFIFAAAMSFAFFAIAYYAVFPNVGYQSSAEFILTSYKESKLFVYGASGYERLTSHYDSNKTPEQNYDEPISYFYQSDARAVGENQYDLYTTRKINSGLYELNGENECVRKSTVSTTQAREYLSKEYDRSVTYFFSNPDLKAASRTVSVVMAVGLLIVVTIGSSIMYLLIPLVDKRNRTFAYMIFKLIPVDKESLLPISKSKNLLRNFIFITVCYISAFTMNLWFGTLAYSFIPFFINAAVLSFSRNNTGVNDIATNVNVINQSYSNSFEVLKAIKQQGGNQ